jgi:hypothetical protein
MVANIHQTNLNKTNGAPNSLNSLAKIKINSLTSSKDSDKDLDRDTGSHITRSNGIKASKTHMVITITTEEVEVLILLTL